MGMLRGGRAAAQCAFVFLLASVEAAAQNRPVVRVDAGPSNLRRNADRYFDRYHPPKPMGESEAAYTEGQVRCQTEANAAAKVQAGRKSQPCVARITIQAVSVLVQGEISVHLPNPPSRYDEAEHQNWKVLQAHEEGHALIYREIFARFARPTVEEVFAKAPPAFNISIPRCSDEGIRTGMDRELDLILDALTAEAVARITSIFKQVNEAYDLATDHGRQGADGGEPSAANQTQAAQQALQKFQPRASR